MKKFIFIIILLIVIFEFYIRYTSPIIHESDKLLGWKLKKNLNINLNQKTLKGEKYKVNFQTNENGSRIYGNFNDSEIIILAIGDSFTNMPYASNDKMWFSIFSEKLEYETNKKVYLEAIGAGGYGNLQQYLLAKNLKHKIDPDFILFQFCNNDFMDNTLEWEILSFNRNQFMRRPYIDEENLKIKYYEGKLKFFYTSYLFENIRSLNRFELFISVFQSLFRNYFFKKGSYDVKEEIKEKSIKTTVLNLKKIRELYKDKNIFVFNCSKDERYPYKYWDEIARANKMFTIDLFENFTSTEDLFYKDGGHFNEKGNYMIGDLLYKSFIKQHY